jgi:hypothetical protein
MIYKKLFDRVITVKPTRKNSGPERIRDDGHYEGGDRRAPQYSD